MENTILRIKEITNQTSFPMDSPRLALDFKSLEISQGIKLLETLLDGDISINVLNKLEEFKNLSAEIEVLRKEIK